MIADSAHEILQGILDKHEIKQGLPKLSPESIEGLYSLAYQYYECGKYPESSKFFRFLTLIGTQEKKHWMGLGASLKMQKDYEQAVQAYSVAAVLDPKDPYIHVWAADCLFAMNQIEKGLKGINTAIKMAKMKKAYHPLLPELELIREAWVKKVKK